MKKQTLQLLIFIVFTLLVSCSGDEAAMTNDDNPPVANNELSINSLPPIEFALFRIEYRITNEDGTSPITQTIKSYTSSSTTNIDLDDYYEEGKANYLVVTRMGVLLPSNDDVGLWLMEPDIKFYIEDDFTNYTEWYRLDIEVKKENGIYSFTKA